MRHSKKKTNQPRMLKKAHPTLPGRWQRVSINTINKYINQAGQEYGLKPDFIKAVVFAESNFKNHALSPKGAMGLMQLMPGTARDLNVKNPWNPKQNIFGGTRYLKSLLLQFNKVDKALAAYNWGPGNILKNKRWPKETRDYVGKVIKRYRHYRDGKLTLTRK